jgi:hypothetical protein
VRPPPTTYWYISPLTCRAISPRSYEQESARENGRWRSDRRRVLPCVKITAIQLGAPPGRCYTIHSQTTQRIRAGNSQKPGHKSRMGLQRQELHDARAGHSRIAVPYKGSLHPPPASAIVSSRWRNCRARRCYLGACCRAHRSNARACTRFARTNYSCLRAIMIKLFSVKVSRVASLERSHPPELRCHGTTGEGKEGCSCCGRLEAEQTDGGRAANSERCRTWHVVTCAGPHDHSVRVVQTWLNCSCPRTSTLASRMAMTSSCTSRS